MRIRNPGRRDQGGSKMPEEGTTKRRGGRSGRLRRELKVEGDGTMNYLWGWEGQYVLARKYTISGGKERTKCGRRGARRNTT
jgi:hypothetical protein